MKYSRIINAFLVGCLLVMPAAALAQGLGPVDPQSVGGVAKGALIPAVLQIVNWLLALVALVAALYLLYGGLLYITSAGDQTKADKAKNTILYALVGLVVIALSFVIVNFVVSAFAGA